MIPFQSIFWYNYCKESRKERKERREGGGKEEEIQKIDQEKREDLKDELSCTTIIEEF